jgi:DNA-binding LacI/PurR family transcriptional regulator
MAETSKVGGKVSSTDVAKLAGVSRSAVSRTFTPGAYVSAETRAAVTRAADLLGYRPNMMARSLITNRTNIVGIITTHLGNPFYATLLEGLIEALQSKGLAALTFIADETSNDEQISRLLSYQVDALVLTNTSLSSAMAMRCSQGATPVVAINRYFESEQITSVTCDNAAAGARVADLFMDKGRERIAFMAGEVDTSSSRDRERGFVHRLSERGGNLFRRVVGNYDHDEGAIAARRMLGDATLPDAIFCANDLMAFATLDVARKEYGLSIPDDLVVVGFDNSEVAEWPAYRLTSVDQNIAGMIEVAVGEIAAAISGPILRGRHLQVAGSLVERESTGAISHTIDTAS